MTDGFKTMLVIVFVAVVLAAAFMVFRARSQSQQLALLRGPSSPVLPTSWDTGDVQDTMDAMGAHH